MANPNTGIHATQTRGFERPGAIGQVADNSPHNRGRDLINTNPQAVQVSSATFSTGPQPSYTFEVGGIPFTWTPASAPATDADTAAEFTTWWNSQPILRAWMEATNPGAPSAVVVLTGQNVGMVIDLDNPSAGLAFATTSAAAEADAVEFARALVATGYATPADAQLDPNGTILAGVVASLGAMTAQDDVFTVAGMAGGTLLISVEIVGIDEPIAVLVDFNTSIDQTLDDAETVLLAALADLEQAPGAGAFADALVDVEGPTTSGNAGELAIMAAVDGVEIKTSMTHDVVGAGYAAITKSSNVGLASSLPRAFAGVSKRATDEVPSQVGASSSSYAANSGVRVLADGPIWVESDQSPAWGDKVWIGMDAGAGEAGRFFNSPGANRIPVPASLARWLYSARSGEGDEAAVVRILASV